MRAAQTQADVDRAQAFRGRFFGTDPRTDADAFDTVCTHILVEDVTSGALVACFRLSLFTGDTITASYAAQFYDLASLCAFQGPMMEMGRLCSDPHCRDPDVLRLVWIAMARFVDCHDVCLLFGCASFTGVDPCCYLDGFAWLRSHHLAPDLWAPSEKAPEVFRFASDHEELCAASQTNLPPLLRSYVDMGAWVSDHAVIDRALGTLHVFTGLEIEKIPTARARLLRAG